MFNQRAWFCLAFLVGGMVFLPVAARAVICDGTCYAVTSCGTFQCSNSQGCKNEIGITCCIPGCLAESCSTSYGLCCGQAFQEQNISGQSCQAGARPASTHSY